MKQEFIRYGLQKLGLFVIILQSIGAVGLIIGFKYPPILLISALGLSLLMLAGLIVRLRLKDSLSASFPAFVLYVIKCLYFY